MNKVFLEYVWLDGHNPQNLRSKTKVLEELDLVTSFEPKSYPTWSFDGSSTKQSGDKNIFGFEGTDCILKPVYVVNDPFRGLPHKIVLCEVFNPDGETPHVSNSRYKLRQLINELKLKEYEANKYEIPWFGWEQEYVIVKPLLEDNPFVYDGGLPISFKFANKYRPRPQGEYYCGVGGLNVIGRNISEEHLRLCAEIGLDISGVNAEVLIGQWEYQIGTVTALNGSDQLWISRYILKRVAEKYGYDITLHPKPVKGDWNGSGCHVNFSTKETRDSGGLSEIMKICDKLSKRHEEHISEYGEFNDLRLTGNHETSNIKTFSFGNSDRGSSIRIPVSTYIEKKGYFEDRRPSSNCDPYKVSRVMIETVYDKIEIIVE
jgi:glutamine synthetase